ncbi:proline racemase family protein [Deinococcus cellulosilyticus]|uniref:4-hydroxyproline epimerase n=1 Tax=Deinococcus cellulosilyticus (strain DSM 18568 / NBRC 106333 / KACC 11606 / 5516J-15) TaxID=1223518 RepID=A0A511N5Y3_DEIC1|nr:proline racemase family protein [Deinococcus cellulosilyticus]GEM48272.1 hydroxyproline-2-epimerase [Deinococcus cellulosilyticus NBRC 106333 = KACC 11606]
MEVPFIDSHTAGEPTRVVVAFPFSLGEGSLAEQREVFKTKWDHFRRAVCNEPRASDTVVGALLVSPTNPDCVTGVIFFNNVSVLGMCGHGTIGVVRTLQAMGRITPGEHLLETPVGVVRTTLHEDGRVTVQNVPAYRHLKQVQVEVPEYGTVTGDVAWGGNWFFLIQDGPVPVEFNNLEKLTDFTWAVRKALEAQGITGKDGALIDHIEVFGPSEKADSRNFVLCPGKAYDRSPCGTGTSAKLACLAAEGKLQEGEVWKQESIIGSVFEGTYQWQGNQVVPSITGTAFVNMRGVLVLDETDPYCWGIQA